MTGFQPLTGWGRTAPTHATIETARSDDDIRDTVLAAGSRGVLARGLGRTYGDAAQNAGGRVLDMTGRDRMLTFDAEVGLIVVEAGMSLDRLMRVSVPKGWFVPVSPGTRFVTVGGAIAADIHGKNHHHQGTFCQHVRSIDLLTADGDIRSVGPDAEPELFWATAGGMGLTGIVLRAAIQLIPIRTSAMLVDKERAGDLDALMSRMTDGDERYTYSVSWIDLVARGRRLGRGVLTRGSHAEPDQLPRRRRVTAHLFAPGKGIRAPAFTPGGLLNRQTVAAFNSFWYHKAPRWHANEIQTIPAFFHPLDGVADWNRIYGPRGFVQYQFVLPFGAEATLRQIIERLAGTGNASFLAVLKRFGPGSPGLLSFPRDGWTLAIDIPARWRHSAMLDAFDAAVAAAGGRIYLAKDARARPDHFEAMYQQLDEFREIRRKVDPRNVFRSDLARRLSL
jgi:decaprenylphospho-beta-D-ribofuranose 2-oxidase